VDFSRVAGKISLPAQIIDTTFSSPMMRRSVRTSRFWSACYWNNGGIAAASPGHEGLADPASGKSAWQEVSHNFRTRWIRLHARDVVCINHSILDHCAAIGTAVIFGTPFGSAT